MTISETVVLLMALKVDGPLRYREVYKVKHESAWAILNSLRNQGALEHPAYDRWQITEKGRIAAALAMAKNRALADAFTGGIAA